MQTAPEQGTTESEVLLLLVEAVVASHAGEAAGDADGQPVVGGQLSSGAWGAEGDGGDVEGPWVIDAADEASLLQAAAVTQWGERLQAAAFFQAARARAARTARLWAHAQVRRSLFTSDFSFFYLLTTPPPSCFPLTSLIVASGRARRCRARVAGTGRPCRSGRA